MASLTACDAAPGAALDPARCHAALSAHDARFDGLFYVGVTSTGIYCRPVCRVRVPKAQNCRYFAHAAAAESAGFRPCLRCRPELAPGLAPVDAVPRLARLAAQRIQAGALNDGTLDALAAGFGVSARHLRRAVEAAYGVSPIALAQTHRLLLAKQLLTDTSLKVIDIAYASGFGSLRRFNDAFQRHYRLAPTALRRRARPQADTEAADPPPAGDDAITLRLGYRAPLAWDALAGFLASRGAPRVDTRLDDGSYARTVALDGHAGWIHARPDPRGTPTLQVRVSASLLPVLVPLQPRLHALFDLDAQPDLIDAHLAHDPLLRPGVAATPGLRVPGTLDTFDLALRAVLGQQVSVRAATTLYSRFVAAFGDAVSTPWPALDRTAPTAARVAQAPLPELRALGLPAARAHTVHTLARHFAADRPLEPGPDALAHLQALPGIGPWTAHYIALRALRDPDALPASDLGLFKALGTRSAKAVEARARAWQPWRGYATFHLWRLAAAPGSATPSTRGPTP